MIQGSRYLFFAVEVDELGISMAIQNWPTKN